VSILQRAILTHGCAGSADKVVMHNGVDIFRYYRYIIINTVL